MGETCFHIPARIFGFESSATEAAQPTRQAATASPSALETRASLLSRLLKEGSSQMPVTYMDASEYSDSSDDDMEEGDCEEEPGDNSEEDGSIPIPPTSESFLRQQREAHARFVYAVQIEEMRRQCAQYFARIQRAGASNNSNVANNTNFNATTSAASVTIPQQAGPKAKSDPGF
ncbi:hypothetical protein HYH02_014158 [Chlamydomonas schloesseri]|uniref:Uncharacterized protein n=1 Tax=Chlamydomonas schloesseri TaxID=2026947 RepID=A0A835SP02_9CHLO|nr:hypothetical protein HYH02_014158 [Chlamydomonas schloesseri]|eukprot:KAG2429121.1 hypothetical protein HYH02_014158 [Chlamydomonas schloesseri]